MCLCVYLYTYESKYTCTYMKNWEIINLNYCLEIPFESMSVLFPNLFLKLRKDILNLCFKIKKGEKERYTHLNAEFQILARRDKKALLSDQCKEI